MPKKIRTSYETVFRCLKDFYRLDHMSIRIFKDQCLASTNLDRQGERLSKEFLERFCAGMGTKFPVHQQHDMQKSVAGYIENARLLPDPDQPNEWCLIGDVSVDEGSVEDVLGGFSISGVEMIRYPETASALLYLPFPHYNDTDLLSELSKDSDLRIGKWIKKGAEPIGWVLLGSVITFAITPIWDDVYKRKVAPRVDNLLAKFLHTLRSRGLSTELVQIILIGDSEVEVRIIPVKGKEELCLGSQIVIEGLRNVVDVLSKDTKAQSVGVKRIVIFFDESLGSYKIHRIEFANGTVQHVV